MGSSLLKFRSLALLTVAATLILAIACGSDDDTSDAAPTPDVAKLIQDAFSAAPQGASAAEIQSLVSQSVTAAISGIPQGASAAEIQSLVSKSVTAAISGQQGITRADVEAAVNAAVASATAGGLSATDVKRIVDQSVRSLPAPQIDVNQLRSMVSQSVAASVPEGVSAAEINKMVTAAVNAAQAGAITQGDLQDLVAKSIQDAAAGQLTSAEVQKIVSASLVATNAAIEAATAAAQGASAAAQGASTAARNAVAAAQAAQTTAQQAADAAEAAQAAATKVKYVPANVERGGYWSPVYYGPHPTELNEAPMLAALVAQGKLPPVEQRVPILEDSYIIPPMDEIGVYGGIMRVTAHYSPGWSGLIEGGCVRMGASGVDHVPGMCKSFELSPDGRVYTFELRDGAKWSDGAPLTTEDFRFAWEDLHSNPEWQTRFQTTYLDKVTGNPAAFKLIDDYTWSLTFDSPNYTVLEEKANILHLCYGSMSECYFAPAHYSKNYHPDYVSKAKMDAMIAADDFSTWKEVFSKYNSSHLGNIEIYRNLPIMGSFQMQEKDSSSVRTERNPYFMGIDPEGNQLPYMDGVFSNVVESREVGALRSMSGELDFGSHSLSLTELPLYLSNMERGDFSILNWFDPGGCSYCFWANQTYNEDKEVAMWIRTPDFRKALSLAMDRNSMNEVVLLGLGTPQNWVPHPSIQYYPGDEWKLLDATLDVPRAKQILDGLGLVDTDGDGFRNRKDGTGNLELFFNATGSGFSMIEIAQQDFADVGIKLSIKESGAKGIRTNTEYFSMGNSLYEANPWGTYWSRMAPTYGGSALGPSIGLWYQTKGDEGMAPTGPDPAYLPLAPANAFPADSTGVLTELLDMWNRGHGLAKTDPNRIELGKELYRMNAKAKYTINIVGFGGHPTRSLHIQRNNFRNVPKNHFPATDSRFHSLYSFEGGIDNLNHPGNRSKLYRSTSFLD